MGLADKCHLQIPFKDHMKSLKLGAEGDLDEESLRKVAGQSFEAFKAIERWANLEGCDPTGGFILMEAFKARLVTDTIATGGNEAPLSWDWNATGDLFHTAGVTMETAGSGAEVPVLPELGPNGEIAHWSINLYIEVSFAGTPTSGRITLNDNTNTLVYEFASGSIGTNRMSLSHSYQVVPTITTPPQWDLQNSTNQAITALDGYMYGIEELILTPEPGGGG